MAKFKPKKDQEPTETDIVEVSEPVETETEADVAETVESEPAVEESAPVEPVNPPTTEEEFAELLASVADEPAKVEQVAMVGVVKKECKCDKETCCKTEKHHDRTPMRDDLAALQDRVKKLERICIFLIESAKADTLIGNRHCDRFIKLLLGK